MNATECFKIDVSIQKDYFCFDEHQSILRIGCGSKYNPGNPIIIEADPFLFVHNNRLFLFYEDKRYLTPGVISMCYTDDLEHWSEPKVVLQEPYHLSYPYVFEDGGCVYMVPETSADHSIRLYKAQNGDLTQFSFESYLIQRKDGFDGLDIDYSDSSVYKKDGFYYLMTTCKRCDGNELLLYYSKDLKGPYLQHPSSPIVISQKIGRNAGAFIEKGHQLFRVAQDCVLRYGDNVHLMEIIELTPASYKEHLVKENLLPLDNPFYKHGGHQYSVAHFKGKIVVATDAKEYKVFFLSRLVRKILRLFHLSKY